MKRTRMKLPLGLHGLIWREGKWFVAKCVEIEVASQGKTKKDALANLSEALSLYFEGETIHKPPSFAEIELLTLRTSYA